MAKTAADTAGKAFETMSSTANEAFKKSYERSVELMGEMTDFNKKNMEAMAESSHITTKGIEEISSRAASYSRDAFEKGVEAARSFSGAQSVQEAMELQANYTKSAFEAYLEQMNAMSGMFATVFREASAPLNSQAGEFVSMMQKSA